MTIPRLTATEQIWWATAALHMLLFAGTLVAYWSDRRILDGASVWAKPLKFEISIALHFATVALITHALSPSWRGGPLLLVVAVLSALSAVGEIAYIIVQAARHQSSHFNLSTPFYAAMYSAMAVGAVLILTAAVAVGIAIVADGQVALSPPVRLASAAGLIGGTVLTLVVAFTMGARLNHHVGTEPIGAARMLFTGWSMRVGDFRPPHFFATHMIQALPLGGLVAMRLLPAAGATAAVVALTVGWTLLTLGLYRQALSGRPFLSLFAL